MLKQKKGRKHVQSLEWWGHKRRNASSSVGEKDQVLLDGPLGSMALQTLWFQLQKTDFGFLASITLWEEIHVVLSHQVCDNLLVRALNSRSFISPMRNRKKTKIAFSLIPLPPSLVKLQLHDEYFCPMRKKSTLLQYYSPLCGVNNATSTLPNCWII